MSRRFDRSRSPPRRGSKEWIAKQIVVFGRYEDKRPRGLAVNSGSMTLSNLMDVWGDPEGIRSSKVLEALKMNMTQPDGGSRFEIERVENDVKIIVNPRCGGSSYREPLQRRQRAHSLEDLSLKKKMDMDLDEIIASERGSSSRSKPLEIIDLEAPDFDLASLKPPPGQNFACTGWARRRPDGQFLDSMASRDMDHSRPEHSHKVKVSKFVSYVLKRGHAELGIDLWEGWANLHDLVRAVHRERFGNYNLQDLKNVLQDTDDVGRFRYWNDWIRKVDRADRLANAASTMEIDSGVSVNLPPVNGLSSGGPPAASGDRPPLPFAALPAPGDKASPPLATLPALGDKPPPPPGIGWTQYNDEGKYWWYYEGPQGKWWCDDDNEPMPWTFDD